MKAFFLFKDGNLVGSPLGYTTKVGAKKSLVGTEDWQEVLNKYDIGNGRKSVPQELIDMGLYEWGTYSNSYIFNRDAWSRKIWSKYFDEHYKIEEKEFEIVFKD